jgi:hypothetical protein
MVFNSYVHGKSFASFYGKIALRGPTVLAVCLHCLVILPAPQSILSSVHPLLFTCLEQCRFCNCDCPTAHGVPEQPGHA